MQLVEASINKATRSFEKYQIEIDEQVELEPVVDEDLMEKCVTMVRNLDRLYGPIMFPPKTFSGAPRTPADEAKIINRKVCLLRHVLRLIVKEIKDKEATEELTETLKQRACHEVARALLVAGLFRLHLKLEHLTWLRIETALSDSEVRRYCRDAKRSRDVRYKEAQQ